MPSERKVLAARMPPGWTDERIDAMTSKLAEKANVEISRSALVFAALAAFEAELNGNTANTRKRRKRGDRC